MAKPKTYSGSLVAIYLHDADEDKFIRPCGLTQHSVAFSKNMNEVDVPDCDDPDLPAWIEREVSSLDLSGNGSGVLAASTVDLWWEAFEAKESIPARVYIGKPDDVANGRYWEGRIHISSFDVTGNKGEKAQVSVAFASDGEVTFHKITAP